MREVRCGDDSASPSLVEFGSSDGGIGALSAGPRSIPEASALAATLLGTWFLISFGGSGLHLGMVEPFCGVHDQGDIGSQGECGGWRGFVSISFETSAKARGFYFPGVA